MVTLPNLYGNYAHELNFVYAHDYHSELCNVCFQFIQNN